MMIKPTIIVIENYILEEIKSRLNSGNAYYHQLNCFMLPSAIETRKY
jgi:hypothetical protein